MFNKLFKKIFFRIAFISIGILFFGCEKEYSEVVDAVRNIPPIVKNLQAPDTLNLHPTDTLIVYLRIEVYDPDGYSDIKTVFFNSFLPDGSPSRSNPIYLFDDGNFQTNGDLFPRDGIFSRIIILPPNTPKGRYRFDFQAIDKKDEQSNTISHIIIVK